VGVHFNLPKFTDCDSNQQRAGYGEARRGGKSLKDLPLQSCQQLRKSCRESSHRRYQNFKN